MDKREPRDHDHRVGRRRAGARVRGAQEHCPLARGSTPPQERDGEKGRRSGHQHEGEGPQRLGADALRDEELPARGVEEKAERSQEKEADGGDQRHVAKRGKEASPRSDLP